jgi:Xaa-Pro dipeptidase
MQQPCIAYCNRLRNGSTVPPHMSSEGPWAKPFPRFSDAEMKRRREALEAAMEDCAVEHVVVYGANRFGSAVQWLTRWPVTREAFVVVSLGEADALFVNFYNHVPNAARIATEADVRWAGPSVHRVIDELARRGAEGRRIGVIGPLGYAHHARLAAFADIVDLNGEYVQLRLIKSPEEIAWLRVGASMTDAAMAALQAQASSGMNAYELGSLVECAYIAQGGTTHIHYFGATSMSEPNLILPEQWPSTRAMERGDALVCEISATFWDYSGQLLRTFAVDADPTPLYSELHDTADAAFDAIFERVRPGATAAELVAAASVIEDAGFTTCDDLVHGFVGGYLPPVLGSSSRTLEPIPNLVFEEGMVVVIQPNVITVNERAGVQTGELVMVGADGAERLHAYERGFLRIGAAW